MHKDQLEKLEDFSTYREKRSKLEASCQENPGEKKILKIHNSDMQTFSLEIPPQFLPSHRETESQLPSCCKRQKSLEY